MSELRQNKLSSLIQAQASRFFVEEASELNLPAMVLVDGVIVSPDLKNAQVWVSFSRLTNDKAKKGFTYLEKNLYKLKNYLFKNLTLRRMPEIMLRLSNADKAFHLMDIFDTIRSHGTTLGNDSTDSEGGESDNSNDAH